MRDRKAAMRYARALFEDALARKAVGEAAEDLALLNGVWQQSPQLVALLAHPLVELERKRELCREHLAPRVRPEHMHFVDLLVQRRRAKMLPAIYEAFRGLVDDHQGIVRAGVWSAAPLTEDEQARLARAIAAVFGGTPVMSAHVRPDLIGGVTVRVKDAVIDGSVRTSLDMLAADLRAVSLDVSAFEHDAGPETPSTSDLRPET
ncbi:MAG: ATP synthase F1 subunit delta [Armatimonadetes bacterium]|nr:ATP synthase F1 subunit delta [Armatimonadota bacterium]